MKKGKSLVELAQEVTRINEAKRDYIVPIERLHAEAIQTEKGEKLAVSFANGEKHRFGLTDWSRSQLASYTDIPKQYFDRIAAENPILAADNVNHGLERIQKANKKQESRLIRTLDGNARGLLSSRYRILDMYDMLENTLPTLLENKMEVVSSEITDKKMYLKVLSPNLKSEVSKGDVVQYGLTISTSDVGAGSVRVEPLIYRLICSNGMIANTSLRKYHVGKNQAEDDIRELLSDDTRELTDRAFWATVKDLVISSMKPENFERQVDVIRQAAGQKIENFDLPKVVELAMKETKLTGEKTANSILAALASGNEGAGLTKWGLVNSFTRAAQSDEFSFEQSIELERAGGAILTLPRTSWERISSVA